MALHLISLNIDPSTAHYRAEKGYLQRLMRGIYVDAGDNINETVLHHAVRIAKYLYPNAYLSAASSILLGPTSDGRLFISARRNQRTRLRALEIVQIQAPRHPSVAPATITDPIGEIVVDVSSLRQRLLEAFRSRSEHAASMTDSMKQDIVQRLIEEYKSPTAAAEAVWSLARENEWRREGEQAERWLLRQQPSPVAKAETNIDLHVAWHSVPIGRLRHDGFEWRWTPEKVDLPSPVRNTIPGKLPPFISSLMPEGWLEKVLQTRTERDLLLSGRRYMSNIAIVKDLSELIDIPKDEITADLAGWSDAGRFTGSYGGPRGAEIEKRFEDALAAMYHNADTPRLSGVQIKAPMYLDTTGHLIGANGKPFTHILKPAGKSGFEDLPIVEWLALELAARVNFEVPAHALVQMPDELPPALLVQRFDIRKNQTDTLLYCLEDFCSLLDLATEAKYHSTIERVARALRAVSTAPEADLLTLFKRAVFAWLIADGDMHLKNLAVVRTGVVGDKHFRSVRFAPVYDAVPTRVFPGFSQDRMALKLNGKDDKLRKADFMTLARTIGLRVADAEQAINTIRHEILLAASEIRVPAVPGLGQGGKERVQQVLEIVAKRSEDL